MAVAFGAYSLNGVNTKIFTVTGLDNDAAANVAVVFNPVLPDTALDASIVQTVTNGLIPAQYAVTAMATTGCTVRKLTVAGGGANAHTVQVTIRSIHSIDR